MRVDDVIYPVAVSSVPRAIIKSPLPAVLLPSEVVTVYEV
jgi:hypothetical protein